MAYTTDTNKLNIVDLDFDSIKASLIKYLDGQDTFKDYNFEGSAMNILMDVLAYNTHYNGFYTNMLASEMFIDSATLRSSVVSLAKHLGYVPTSKTGSTVLVDLSIEDPTNVNTSNYVQIPVGTKFVSRKADTNKVYTFLAEETVVAYKNSGTDRYEVKSVTLREGISFSKTYSALGIENEKFEIPNPDVDISTISVLKGGVTYSSVTDITKITAKSRVYWLQEGLQEKYEIYFGDGIIGDPAQLDDVIVINYHTSALGSEGNLFQVFVLADVLGGMTALVTTASLAAANPNGSSGGADRETTSSIKRKAPLQFVHQDRYVTTEDYRTSLLNNHNELEHIRVWGGSEHIPPTYGTVFISAKLKNGLGLTTKQKLDIVDEVGRRNPASITPVVIDPEFMEILLNCDVTFDPTETTMTPDSISELVIEAIREYALEINDFDDYFRYSVFLDRLSDKSRAIKNSTAALKLRKTIRFTTSTAGGSILYFDNRLKRFPSENTEGCLKTWPPFEYKVEQVSYVECELIESNGIVALFGVPSRLLTPRGRARGGPRGHSPSSQENRITRLKRPIREIGYIYYDDGIIDIRGRDDKINFNKISIN
ncbi:MAG TPA: hypothetical protein EYO59_03905, partial [Chromatiaceae bacterium]|nr:hypothetical protein [Chromatiaceae bacterium]